MFEHDYKTYTKNDLIKNERGDEIFDKNNEDYLSYTSDEFEPKCRLIIGARK